MKGRVSIMMTFKEFLKMNTNGPLLDIYIYDKDNRYLMCQIKEWFVNNTTFLDDTFVLSFALEYCEGLIIKLDF